MPATMRRYRLLPRSKPRLNRPKNPVVPPWPVGLSRVAHSAGDSTRATVTDSSIDDASVSENWR